MPEQAETTRAAINWDLLDRLATKPHPLLNIADDFERQIRETPLAWTGEVFQEARSAHHLLDMVGVPAEKGYPSDLDARTYLAIRRIQDAEERLARIEAWHSREAGPGGLVGDYCNECGQRWPCDTRRMAEGMYVDPDAAAGRAAAGGGAGNPAAEGQPSPTQDQTEEAQR